MDGQFKRILVISSESSRLERDEFLLQRITWDEVGTIKNLADYDHVIVNLEALKKEKIFSRQEFQRYFDTAAYAHLLRSKGKIFFVGKPDTLFVFQASPIPAPKQGRFHACACCLQFDIDPNPLDYRRVDRGEESLFRDYLDRVNQFDYSIKTISLNPELLRGSKPEELLLPTITKFGTTKFASFLAAVVEVATVFGGVLGALYWLPSSGKGPAEDDLFILQHFMRLPMTVPEPAWLAELKVPGQLEIEQGITGRTESIAKLRSEIAAERIRLAHCRRWSRLLYDDGNSLEGIVKEAFEFLGASVVKKNTVKDDFRLKFGSNPEVVMEIKGTHNAQFTKGAIRQLSGWMDEVLHDEQKDPKGFFVGNSDRKNEPTKRGRLVDPNTEIYAANKKITVLRTMDLYCLVILAELKLVDLEKLWVRLFECKGQFDAAGDWKLVPFQFRV